MKSFFSENEIWLSDLGLKFWGDFSEVLEASKWLAFNASKVFIFRPRMQKILNFQSCLSLEFQ
jgi:hypothetical protein